MEREIRSLSIRLSPEDFVTLCRCVNDDFETYYDQCKLEPYEDNSDLLDRMEADLDLLEGLLPYISSQSTTDAILLLLADFKKKIAEVA